MEAGAEDMMDAAVDMAPEEEEELEETNASPVDALVAEITSKVISRLNK